MMTPVTSHEHTEGNSTIHVPTLTVTDTIKQMLTKFPWVLFGGFGLGAAAQETCQEWWEAYERIEPDHPVFVHHRSRLNRVIAITLHGDKGTGPKKQAATVIDWEPVLGLDTANYKRKAMCLTCSCCEDVAGAMNKKRRIDDAHDLIDDLPDLIEDDDEPELYLRHNGNYHSFATRFLYTCYPRKTADKAPRLLDSLSDKIGDELHRLFYHGVCIDGVVYYVAVVGQKADAEWHVQSGHLNRSYQNCGTANETMVCSECLVGARDTPFEDIANERPVWLQTVDSDENVDPWVVECGLTSKIPFCTNPKNKKRFFKRDLFHVFKFGFGRDAVGSGIVMLCNLGYFNDPASSNALPVKLSRASSAFHLYNFGTKKNASLREFTQALFHMPRVDSYPAPSFKGADTMLIARWLRWYCNLALNDPRVNNDHVSLLRGLHDFAEAAVEFFRLLHGHGLWLKRACAKKAYKLSRVVLTSYNDLALDAYHKGMTCFPLRPKAHAFHHFSVDIKKQLDDVRCKHVLNPLIFNCEMNEDFVGRICRLARKVSPRLTSRRVIDRYLVASLHHIKAIKAKVYHAK